jgi:hypothetical protein
MWVERMAQLQNKCQSGGELIQSHPWNGGYAARFLPILISTYYLKEPTSFASKQCGIWKIKRQLPKLQVQSRIGINATIARLMGTKHR